jgi:hypothetical protein
VTWNFATMTPLERPAGIEKSEDPAPEIQKQIHASKMTTRNCRFMGRSFDLRFGRL